MANIETYPWDPAEHLETEEDMALYLEACLEENDPALITAALGDIARAQGMGRIAQAAGIDPGNLDRTLSAEGNPEFATVLKVVHALGLRLHASIAP